MTTYHSSFKKRSGKKTIAIKYPTCFLIFYYIEVLGWNLKYPLNCMPLKEILPTLCNRILHQANLNSFS